MPKFTLNKSQTGLLIVDVQEKVFATADHSAEFLAAVIKAVKGFAIFQIPILITEQYPQGLGETLWPIKSIVGEHYRPFVKTAFSCSDDPAFLRHVQTLPIRQWVLIGLEAHICVLQTAKGLMQLGKDVVVLNDAISSKSIFDFSTAIAEMRDEGIRISSVETVLFELLKDSRAPEFKAISTLVKTSCQDMLC